MQKVQTASQESNRWKNFCFVGVVEIKKQFVAVVKVVVEMRSNAFKAKTSGCVQDV